MDIGVTCISIMWSSSSASAVPYDSIGQSKAIPFLLAGLQKIDAEEQAVYEEMLSAAGMVEEEARQRFRKLREAKEVTQLCFGHNMLLPQQISVCI